MTRLVLASFVAASVLAAVSLAQQPAAPAADKAAPELKTPQQQASYGIGLSIGRNLKEQGMAFDPAAVMRGLSDALTGAKPALTDAQLQAAMQALGEEMAARATAAADKNKKEGDAFLNANKAKEGVVTRPSGLQYKVLKQGNGPSPKPTDTVSTHYRGTLVDGTEFDASGDEPVSFPVNRVIRGWQEVLPLMKVGDKWQVFVPSDLAYGEDGAGAKIGPNSALIFEIELLDVKPGAASVLPGLPR